MYVHTCSVGCRVGVLVGFSSAMLLSSWELHPASTTTQQHCDLHTENEAWSTAHTDFGMKGSLFV
jgi:hypothetical protein